MPDHAGLGAASCGAAEDVADAYRAAMRDGRISPGEHVRLLRLHRANVAHSAEVGLSLTTIATVARCASSSRHRRRLVAEWESTGIARLVEPEGDPGDEAALDAA